MTVRGYAATEAEAPARGGCREAASVARKAGALALGALRVGAHTRAVIHQAHYSRTESSERAGCDVGSSNE
ncbi:hypothetical protein RAS1_28600 [Phycisphaerae bacterium RAS1]|nr:hypothetical protein RAS1_28600 [Phycisphaerae bacterium RAS1]